MRVEDPPELVLHAQLAAQRVKHEIEYTFSRVVNNVESSVRSASGLFVLQDLASVDRFKAKLVQHAAERMADDMFAAVPLAKLSVRREKAPAASDAVPGNRSVSDAECTLASVRHPLSQELSCPVPILICHTCVALNSVAQLGIRALAIIQTPAGITTLASVNAAG